MTGLFFVISLIFLSICPSMPMQIGDMSLADNATLCLSAVITQLAVVKAGEHIYKDIVLHTILDAVLKGLRSKTEVETHTSSPVSIHFLHTWL